MQILANSQILGATCPTYSVVPNYILCMTIPPAIYLNEDLDHLADFYCEISYLFQQLDGQAEKKKKKNS